MTLCTMKKKNAEQVYLLNKGDIMITNQKVIIEKWLRDHGSITGKQAMEDCGVYRLSSVIHSLRKRGVDIETIWTSGVLDGKTETSWTPDYFIPADSTVYAIARNINTTAFATGAERIDLSLKIVKYNTKPVNSIIP